MDPLDLTLLSTPKGYRNLGSICYWNSLLQGLGSCTALVRELRKTQDPLAQLLLEALAAQPSDQHINLHNQCMQYLLQKRHISAPLRGQQCAGEAFTLLLTSLESCQLLQNLFLYKYIVSVQCGQCQRRTEPTESKGNLMILPNSRDIPDISQYILGHMEQVEYRCERCRESSAQASQLHKLTLIPEIIVLMFRKEYESEAYYANIPAQLQIQRFRYRPVAFIQHYGGPSGGHYNCIALRVHPASKQPGWFMLDDQSVQYLSPDDDSVWNHVNRKNTYLVIYHLAH